MSDDTSADEVRLTGRSGLRAYYQNMLDRFGTTDSALAGLAINAALAAPGIVAWYALDGWLGGLGLAWAALNIAAIVKWGLE
jgi:hypothetical protein